MSTVQLDSGPGKPIAHDDACVGCDDCRYVPPPKRQEVATATRLASKSARREVDTFIRRNVDPRWAVDRIFVGGRG